MADALSTPLDRTGALVEELPFMDSSDRTLFMDLIRRMLDDPDLQAHSFVLRLRSSNNRRPVVLEMTATMLPDRIVLVTGQVIDPSLANLIDGDSTSVSSLTMSRIGSSSHQESPTEHNDRRQAREPDSSSQTPGESPSDTSSPDESPGEPQTETSGSRQAQTEDLGSSRETLGESPNDTSSPDESTGESQRETSGSSRETVGESPTEGNGALARELEAQIESEEAPRRQANGFPSGELLAPTYTLPAGGGTTRNSQYITTAPVQEVAEPEPAPGLFAFAEPLENHSVGREVESAISSLTMPTLVLASSDGDASGDERMMNEHDFF